MRLNILGPILIATLGVSTEALACQHHNNMGHHCAPVKMHHAHHNPHSHQRLAQKPIFVSPSSMTVQRQGGVNIYRGSGSKPNFALIANNRLIKEAKEAVKSANARAQQAERRARQAERDAMAANERAIRSQSRAERRPRTRRFIGNNRFFGANGFIGNSNFSGATVILPRTRPGFRGRIKQGQRQGRRTKL